MPNAKTMKQCIEFEESIIGDIIMRETKDYRDLQSGRLTHKGNMRAGGLALAFRRGYDYGRDHCHCKK